MGKIMSTCVRNCLEQPEESGLIRKQSLCCVSIASTDFESCALAFAWQINKNINITEILKKDICKNNN